MNLLHNTILDVIMLSFEMKHLFYDILIICKTSVQGPILLDMRKNREIRFLQ